MLIQSHEGYIELLPALPQQWNTGYFKGLCVRGGGEVDLKWKEGQVQDIVIKATADNKFTFKVINTKGNISFPKGAKDVGLQMNTENDYTYITISLKKGQSFEMNCK